VTATLVQQMAVLRPEAVELYDRVHREMSEEMRAVMRRAGYLEMTIHRAGELLFLRALRDPNLAAPEPGDAELSARWHAETSPCFAAPWRRAESIFSFLEC
jgi:L-rhamnose mutarotase